MSTSAGRLLQLLQLLATRRRWHGPELADRLAISGRTLRRDIETLRLLGYPVATAKGPAGGYSLGVGGKLPPLLLDDEQVIALVIALQTAPSSVVGIDDALARTLSSVEQILPASVRAEARLHVTPIRNMWEFAAPPIHADVLREVGSAIRQRTEVQLDYLDSSGRRPAPGEDNFMPPVTVQPHHLVVWAGRWYLVARLPQHAQWRIYRVDRIHSVHNNFREFTPSPPPLGNVSHYVMTTADRGDTAAEWQCLGTVVMELPADVVARWAPGGSVVEPVDDRRCRFTVGAWSWAGIAGLLATFDADFTVVEPDELRVACQVTSRRLVRASAEQPVPQQLPPR